MSTSVVPLCVALSLHCVSTLNPTLLPTLRLRRYRILIYWNRRAKLDWNKLSPISTWKRWDGCRSLMWAWIFWHCDMSERLFLKVILSLFVWFVRISSAQSIPFMLDQRWCIQDSRFVITIVTVVEKLGGHTKGVQRSWITFGTRKLHKIYNHGRLV